MDFSLFRHAKPSFIPCLIYLVISSQVSATRPEFSSQLLPPLLRGASKGDAGRDGAPPDRGVGGNPGFAPSPHPLHLFGTHSPSPKPLRSGS